MTSYSYCTVLAPGCHGRPVAPIISRHRSRAAAIARARRNDRLEVYAYADGHATGECLYAIPMQNDPRLGYGRFGNGLPRC